MATTLARPGVTVTQTVSATSPTVLTPTLAACVVGPCYQIVEPLNVLGAPEAKSLVRTAAQVWSTAALSDPVASTAATYLKIAVDGGTAQVVSLPVTIGGSSLSYALLKKSINAQLVGATADFVSNKLVITSSTFGPSSSVDVQTVSTNAYTALNLTVGKISGKGGYDNSLLSVPFASLPATHAAASKLVFDTNKLDLYRLAGASLKKLSRTSALLANSWSLVGTKVANAALAGNLCQPVLSSRHSLHATKAVAAKSNVLFDPGVPASVVIPLGFANVGANASDYPDPFGVNHLTVEAVGFQNYITDNTLPIGKYVGTAGNAVTVVFVNDGAITPACLVSFNDGNNTLTIKCKNATDTTLADLSAALNNSPVGLDATKNLKVTLGAYAAADAAVKLFGGDAIAATIYLSGGEDPVSFLANGTSGAPADACVLGSVAVKIGGAELTGTDLGISGKTLAVSINGAAYKEATFGAGSVKTTLETALAGVATASVEDIVNARNETVKVLRIKVTAAGTNLGQDCTIHVKSEDPLVMEALFSGRKKYTEVLSNAALAPTYDGRTVKVAGLVAGTDYNKQASALLEKALVPGTTAAQFNGVTLLGVVAAETTDTAVNALTTGLTLAIAHSAVNGGVPITLTLGNDPATAAALALNINAVIDTDNNLQGKVFASTFIPVGAAGDTVCIALSEATGVSGAWVHMATAGTASDIAGALLAVMGGAGNFGTTAKGVTTTSASLTVQDTDTLFAPQVTNVSTGMSHCAFSSVNFSKTSTAIMSPLFLSNDTGANLAVTSLHYTNSAAGTIRVAFRGGLVKADFTATADNTLKMAVAARLPNTATCTLTYTRSWENSFGTAKQDYSRVFHGSSAPVVVGDSLYDTGTYLGRIAAIGTLTGAASDFAGAKLTLTDSTLTNYAKYSNWSIVAEGLDVQVRPVQPEVVVSTLLQTVSIKAAVSRDTAGVAGVSASVAAIYAGYTALRKDVDTRYYNSATDMLAELGPIAPENPLAFAMLKAFENAPGLSVVCLGIDEVTADAPEGTVDAYQRAFEQLELKDVYVIAPLTHNREVFKALTTHINAMSEGAEGRRERIAITCPKQPTEKESTLVESGNATLNEAMTILSFDKDIAAKFQGKKDANGNLLPFADGAELTAEQGVYVDRAGDPYKYLVTKINAQSVNISTGSSYLAGSGPGTGGNDDNYYKEGATALATFEADGETCSIFVRQAAIDVGTTTGKQEACEALQAYGNSIANRRVTVMQPESAACQIDGQEVKVPGYYLCAAWAGMTSSQAPAQPFTNVPINGFTRVLGSHDLFSEKFMSIAAAGGINWIIQDGEGLPPISRHQLTSDVSSLKVREYSVTKAIDMIAKMLRTGIKARIGKYNIDAKWLNETGLIVNAICNSAAGLHAAVVTCTGLSVDTQNPDTAEVSVTIVPFFPANRINVKIFV